MNEFHDRRPIIAFLAVMLGCGLCVFLLSYCTFKYEERRNYDRENQCHPTSETRESTVFSTNCVMVGKVLSCHPVPIVVRETLWTCEANGEKSWR